MYIRRVITAGRVHYWPKIYAFTPLAFAIEFAYINVEFTIAPRSVAGEVKSFAIGRNARTGFPILRSVNVFIEWHRFAPISTVKLGGINIATIFFTIEKQSFAIR